MHTSHLQYLPLARPFFVGMVSAWVVTVLLLRFRSLKHTYASLGVEPKAALLFLLGCLVGSYFNIPIAQLPTRHVGYTGQINAFGVTYLVPLVVDWPGTVVAINVGGALLPAAASIYLLLRRRLWAQGAIAVALVAMVCHLLAHPAPGLGIAMPSYVPGAAAAIVALAISRRRAALLAYSGGSLGALIGADLTNLGSLQGLGAPIVSIGGAGTFDGVFLTGVIAVLIAGISSWFSTTAARRRTAA